MVDSMISWCRENWWLAPAWFAVVIARAVHRSWKRERIRRWIEWWWPHLPLERKENILRVWGAVAEAEDSRYGSTFGEQDPDKQFANIMAQIRSISFHWPLRMLHRLVAEHITRHDDIRRHVPHDGTPGRWSKSLL